MNVIAFVSQRKWLLLASVSVAIGILTLIAGCTLFMHSDSSYTPGAIDDGFDVWEIHCER